MMDWYDRMGLKKNTVSRMMSEEIIAELKSNGKIVSFSTYLKFGMSATQYQKLELAKNV